jgi:hypothetical protein
MFHALRKLIAWFLIATLVIIAGVGEGLHCLPGCGHGVETGGRLLLLGISLPENLQPINDRPQVERPESRDIPIYDEDLCAICSTAGQTCTSVDSFQFVLAVPLMHELPTAVTRDAFAAAVRLFQARAPPLA